LIYTFCSVTREHVRYILMRWWRYQICIR